MNTCAVFINSATFLRLHFRSFGIGATLPTIHSTWLPFDIPQIAGPNWSICTAGSDAVTWLLASAELVLQMLASAHRPTKDAIAGKVRHLLFMANASKRNNGANLGSVYKNGHSAS